MASSRTISHSRYEFLETDENPVDETPEPAREGASSGNVAGMPAPKRLHSGADLIFRDHIPMRILTKGDEMPGIERDVCTVT